MKRNNMFSRRYFIGAIVMLMTFSSCKENKKKENEDSVVEEKVDVKEPFFKLSLAQWSIHKMIWDDGVDPYSFAEKAKEWGFEGLEYVSALYYKELEPKNFSEEAMAAFVEKSNAEAKKHGMKNLLIMIDGQGDLATADAGKKKSGCRESF